MMPMTRATAYAVARNAIKEVSSLELAIVDGEVVAVPAKRNSTGKADDAVDQEAADAYNWLRRNEVASAAVMR